jgi:hypothetical protein
MDNVVCMGLCVFVSTLFIENVIRWRTENSDVGGVVGAIAKSGKRFETRHAHKGGRIRGDEQNEFPKDSVM